MDLKDLIPSFGRKNVPVKREEEHPVITLQREMNRLFDGFLQGWEPVLPASGAFLPRIDMTEDEKAFTLSAELPGMTDKDIELSLTRDVLTIRGEKKNEKKDQRDGYFYSERTFGSFCRTIRVPGEVDPGTVQAEFRKGVLTVRMPKRIADKATAVRKITVQAE